MNWQIILNTFIAISRAEVGTVEVPRGSNTGPRVLDYQAVTALARTWRTGWPWCVGFSVFSLLETWKKLDIHEDFPIPRTADCDELLRYARAHSILGRTPEPGDIALKLESENNAVHCLNIVDAKAEFSSRYGRQVYRLHSIEGNTNNEGSREGYGVFEFEGDDARIDHGQYRYVRWKKMLPFALLNDRAPRLIVAVAPFTHNHYFPVAGAELVKGEWIVPAMNLAAPLHNAGFTGSSAKAPIRELLKYAPELVIDERRTAMGNHTGDHSDPRQYLFLNKKAG